MLRSSLIVAAAGLLCSTAVAQSAVDSGKIRPVTSPVKHAGVVDVVTGKWAPAGAATKAVANIYNNTCFYDAGTGYIYYTSTETCADFYDEGEVPASNNTLWQTVSTGLGGSGTGPVDSQTVDFFEFSYCTQNATVDIEIAFWDNLNGDCIGGVAPTGQGQGHWAKDFGTPGGGTNAPDAYFDLSGLGLPGSTGGMACWFVGISNTAFTLQSDGDGSFDNDAANDKFIWAFRQNDVPPAGSPGANGQLITGDPNVIPSGVCTYDIPCMTDWTGGVCGSGYGFDDSFWVNTDGGIATTCDGFAANATGCYYFLGYPTNLGSSFYMRMEADVGGGGSTTYCTSRPSSIAGCVPTLSSTFQAITKGAAGPVPATAGPVPGGNSPGILIFGKTLAGAPIVVNFGELCLQGFNRAPTTIKPAGGTSGSCSGAYAFDLQVAINNATATQAAPGDTIYFQAWYRDTPNPFGANLTNGMGDFAIL